MGQKENIKRLYNALRDASFSFVGRGEQDLDTIYSAVKKRYSHLCGRSRCCGGREFKWKHTTRTALENLKKRGYVTKGEYGVWILGKQSSGKLPSKSRKQQAGLLTGIGSQADPLADATVAARSLRGLSKTVRDTLIKARLGQGRFRQDLITYWKGCAVTGCKCLKALRAFSYQTLEKIQ